MNLQKIFLDSPSATTSLSSQQEYEIHIHDTAEDDAWDAFLAHTPGSHYFQTSRWAKVKSLAGWQAIRLIVTKARRIVGGMQMLLRPLPWGGQIGYIPKGFVLAEAEPHLAELLLGQMQQLARAYRVQYLVAQPPRQGQILAQQLAAAGFRPNLRMGTIASTLLVDLSPDPETLLAQMQKSTRMNIRRGEKRGIQVREGDAADLPLFYHLLETAARRKHFTVFSAKYYRELWQALAPAGFLKMFIAEYEGEAVTAMLAIPFGDTMYSHISAWSGSHAERKPNETLEWHAMM